MGGKKPRVTTHQAEEAIFSRFSEAYKSHYGASLEEVVHRDKPDFSARDSVTMQALGIEVTGAYQDAREAEINYWLNGDWGILTGSFENLVDNINRALADKAVAVVGYDPIGPILLAIWIGSFVFPEKRDMELLVTRLTMPPNTYSLIALVVTEGHPSSPALHILKEAQSWRRNGPA